MLLGIGGLAAWLRLAGLGGKSLWMDEALSWRLQSFRLSLMIARTGEPTTVHPPLFFGLLHFWTATFGDGEFALRSLSATAGILAVFALYQLVRELFVLAGDQHGRGEFAGMLSALLLAVSSFQIHQSRQARGYSLALLLFCVSSICLLRALRLPERAGRWWTGYALSALACCYTHNLALFTVAAQGLFALMVPYCRRNTRRPGEPAAEDPISETPARARHSRRLCVAALFVVALGYAPWVPKLWAQSETLRTSWTKVRTAHDHAREVFTALLATTEHRPPASEAAAWGAVVVVAAALAFVAVRQSRIGLFVVLTGSLPVLLVIGYSCFSIRNIFHARYLAFAQPAWLIALACVAASFRDRVERLAVSALLVLWSVQAVYAVGQFSPPTEPAGMSSVRDFILKHCAADETVVAQTPFEFFKLKHALRNGPAPRLVAPTRDRRALRGAALLLDEELVTPADILHSSMAGLWLVTSESYQSDGETAVPLPTEWHRIEQRDFEQEYYWERPVRVTHFRRK